MNLKTTLKIFAIGILVVLIALLSVDIFNGSFSFEEKNKLDNLIDATEMLEKMQNRKDGDSGFFGTFFNPDAQ